MNANQVISPVTGAELVALFISRFCSNRVFLVTGGACAFIVDAIGRSDELEYVCFQHEQAAAINNITGGNKSTARQDTKLSQNSSFSAL